jgi:hypothetical protein
MANAQLGIQGGLNVNNYQYKINGVQNDRVATPGFNVGMFYRGRLAPHAVIEPSLLFSRKGAINRDVIFPVDHYRTRLDYVQASLPFMYRGIIGRGMDFTIGGGPFAAALVHADAIAHYDNGRNISEDYVIGNDAPDDFKPFDAGLRFQTGLKIRRINFSMAYDLGLADIAPQNNQEIKTRAFLLDLGFFLW